MGPTESVVIEMTLYRGFFYKDKEREKSGPTKICRYSEFDVIRSVVIEGFDCTKYSILRIKRTSWDIII